MSMNQQSISLRPLRRFPEQPSLPQDVGILTVPPTVPPPLTSHARKHRPLVAKPIRFPFLCHTESNANVDLLINTHTHTHTHE